jgi:hypothetical protein
LDSPDDKLVSRGVDMDIKPSDLNQETPVNEWYLFKNCDKFGPLTAKEISEMLDKNQINKDHHVWHQKYNSWLAIKDVDVFQSVGFESIDFQLQKSKKQVSFVEMTLKPQISSDVTIQEGSKDLKTKKGFISKIISLFK